MVESGESDLYCETLEIRRSVLCIICLGTYCNPATLPCSHTFCRHCILEASRIRLKCPICSADFTKRSLVSETHFSRVVADVVGLVNSLTSKLRYSISIDALDGFYRDRQRIPITRVTPVTSRQTDEGLAQITPSSTTLSYSAGGVNLDVSDRCEISNGPESDFEYCKVDEETLLNRKYATSIVHMKETTSVLDEQNNKKMECGETSSSRLGNEIDCNRFNERIYVETVDFVGCKEVSTACVYEIPVNLPSNDLQQKQDDIITSAGPIVDMEDCGDQDVEVEIKAQELFRPGDIVTVIARMWPGMNKPGGTAWILSCHTHEPDLLTGSKASVSYDVKYVLHGQSDRDVPYVFVVPFLELERKSRKRGIETVMPMSSPIPQKKEKRVKTPKEHSHSNSEEVTRDDTKVEGVAALLISRNEGPNSESKVSVNKKTDTSANQKTKRESISSNVKHGTVKKNICICHTSLEITDFAKLERFLTYFSSSIGVECPPAAPSSSSSSSSSSYSSSSNLVPVLTISPKTIQCIESPIAIVVPSLRLSDKFDKSVTHLIVSTDKKGVLRKRTLKFMQAIMAGVWIVSPLWLADSVTAGEILLEDSYEVPGYQKAGKDFAPKRARLSVHAVRARGVPRGLGSAANIIKNSELSSNHAQHSNIASGLLQPSEQYLFENTVFLLYGSFPNSGPPRSEIADLLCTGKACVVSSIKDLCMKFQSRDPRSHSVKTVEQVCYTDVGVDGKGSMSSGSESREGGMNDRAYSSQSTKGSKILVCTDSQSVLAFLEELSGLISFTSDQLLKNNSELKTDPLGDTKSLKYSPYIRLKMSTKYPIEGSDAYACLIEKINSKLLKSNLDGVDKNSMYNKENDKNQSNYGDSQERGVEEVTILNPTWVFDSISDYSIMSTA